MRRMSGWLKTRVKTFSLLLKYGKAIAKEWMNILFGETVIGAMFLIWWAIVNPKNPPLILIFVAAIFVAGYFVWRADHIRLTPKFKVDKIIVQRTETEDPNTIKMYVQVIPECL